MEVTNAIAFDSRIKHIIFYTVIVTLCIYMISISPDIQVKIQDVFHYSIPGPILNVVLMVMAVQLWIYLFNGISRFSSPKCTGVGCDGRLVLSIGGRRSKSSYTCNKCEKKIVL